MMDSAGKPQNAISFAASLPSSLLEIRLWGCMAHSPFSDMQCQCVRSFCSSVQWTDWCTDRGCSVIDRY
jgi:hypothetical protein